MGSQGWGASRSLLVTTLLLLLGGCGGIACLLLVHDEARVALILVPFEASEVGRLELVVRLDTYTSTTNPQYDDNIRYHKSVGTGRTR